MRVAIGCAAILGALSVPAQAAPFDGTSAATAGLSAAQILTNYAGSASGLYWIDPDGAGGNAAFQIYADMTTSGGGWMLMRHIPGTGGWSPANDNLAGTFSLNPTSLNPNDTQNWSMPLATLGVPFDYLMFQTGDATAWGVLTTASVYAVNLSLTDLNATVIASQGLGVAASGSTNVLNRGPGNPEDPWIGFEGNHFANATRMMYGEGSYSTSPHNDFKNAHGGINVFVREADVPVAVIDVPEPATIAILLTGLVALRAARGKFTGMV
jgi:hypothetical protein